MADGDQQQRDVLKATIDSANRGYGLLHCGRRMATRAAPIIAPGDKNQRLGVEWLQRLDQLGGNTGL